MHQPTTYTFGSNVEDEVQYLKRVIIRDFDNSGRYSNCRLPPMIDKEVRGGKRLLDNDRIRQAIIEDTVVRTPIEELMNEWRSQDTLLFKAFFARMTQPRRARSRSILPDMVRVALTTRTVSGGPPMVL